MLDYVENFSGETRYLVPEKDLNHAIDHLQGIYEIVGNNSDVMYHIEEILSAFGMKLKELAKI